MEFDLERFCNDTTIKQLDCCRRAELLLIADHFNIQVLHSDVKPHLKAKVTAGLFEQKVFSGDAVPDESSVKVKSPEDRKMKPGVAANCGEIKRG